MLVYGCVTNTVSQLRFPQLSVCVNWFILGTRRACSSWRGGAALLANYEGPNTVC